MRLEGPEGIFVRFPDGFLICIPQLLILPLSCARNLENRTQLCLSPNLGHLNDEILTFPQPPVVSSVLKLKKCRCRSEHSQSTLCSEGRSDAELSWMLSV